MFKEMSWKTKAIIIAILTILIGGYAAGIFGQLINPAEIGIRTGDVVTDWAGNVLDDGMEFTFNPLHNYIFAFTSAKMIFIVICAIVIAISVFVYFSKDGADLVDERNFNRSKKGLYGTSGWMTEQEMKAMLDVKNINDTTGTILGIYPKTGKIISLPVDARINKHTAIYGASGTGKSRCFVRPQILQCVARGESIIVTDPKGEIYADTAEFMRKRGYDVKTFNLVDPTFSDSWNCLAEITANPEQIELMSQTFVEVIIKNTSEGHGDHFWDNAEMNLLKALALIIAMDETRNPEQKNIGAAYELITNNDEKKLNAMFDKLPIGHPARAPYSIYKQAGDNVRGNVIIGLGARLQVFQSEIIRKITSFPEIDLEGPAKRKSAFFVIMSDQDSTLDFLSSLFFSFLFIRLVRYADVKGKDGKCDVPVNFILDEFPNIGSIPDFTKKLSTIRSRDLRVAVIFQNIAQLQNRYPDGLWEEIIGNCDTQLFLGCTDQMTAKFIADRSGEMTIEVSSEALQKQSITMVQNIPQYRETKSSGKRLVLTQDEVMRLPNNECLIILRGQKILRLNKFDYSNHPGAELFEHTYVRDYVPQWRAGVSTKIFDEEDDKDTTEEISNQIYQDSNKKDNSSNNFGGGGSGSVSPLGNSTAQPVRQRRPISKVKLVEEEQMDNDIFEVVESSNEEESRSIIRPIPVSIEPIKVEETVDQAPITSTARPVRKRVITAIKLTDDDTFETQGEETNDETINPVAQPVMVEAAAQPVVAPINQYKAGTVIDSDKDDYLDIIKMYSPDIENKKPAPVSIIPHRGPKMVAQPADEEDMPPIVIGVNGAPRRQIKPKPQAQFLSNLDNF